MKKEYNLDCESKALFHNVPLENSRGRFLRSKLETTTFSIISRDLEPRDLLQRSIIITIMELFLFSRYNTKSYIPDFT